MKKAAFIVTAALAILLSFTACEKTTGDTKTLTKITVTDARTIYLKDSTFNKNGISVNAFYNDGTIAAVKDYTMTGFDSAQTGEQTLTVYYQGKSASFDITVVEQGFIDMAEVTGGKWFSMGSNEAAAEQPPHNVILTCFYMGIHEIMQKDYYSIMETNPSVFKGDSLPVMNVSWYDAVEFCNKMSIQDGLEPAYTIDKINQDPNNTSASDTIKWTVSLVDGADGYRLPTEAEWEYACRAGTTTLYNTGDTITAGQANFNYSGSKPVGSYDPNSLGLYDMHGNVWEWCWDWYDEAYYSKSPPPGNPKGPLTGECRVVRGGAWSSDAAELRSSFRERAGADDSSGGLGFRVIRSKYPEGIP